MLNAYVCKFTTTEWQRHRADSWRLTSSEYSLCDIDGYVPFTMVSMDRTWSIVIQKHPQSVHILLSSNSGQSLAFPLKFCMTLSEWKVRHSLPYESWNSANSMEVRLLLNFVTCFHLQENGIGNLFIWICRCSRLISTVGDCRKTWKLSRSQFFARDDFETFCKLFDSTTVRK